MSFEAGLLLADRYRLVNPIATDGALGPLWRAVDRAPDRQIAIRLVRPARSLGSDALDAYLREMELARRLEHPATVRVLDVGRTADGTPWVATELLQVESLESLLARRTLLPGTALRLVADLGAALAEAHAVGLAHLGVEPARVLLHRREDGAIVAKLDGFGRTRLLSARPRVGTVRFDAVPIAYASPEQAAGDPKVDCTTDVWALGVLLFRCVAGRVPFGATTRVVHFAQVRDVARVLEAAKGSIDPHVLGLVSDCLRFARAERPSAEAVADRAQLLSWVTAGGWKDLAKMVRIDEASASPTLRGELVHVSTIPGALPPAPGSVTAPDSGTAKAWTVPDSGTTKTWAREAEATSSAASGDAPDGTAPPISQPTKLLDDLPDLRPKRAGTVAVWGAVGVAALGLTTLALPRGSGARSTAAGKPVPSHRVGRADEPAAPAAASAAKTASVATAQSTPSAAPALAASAKKPSSAAKPSEKPVKAAAKVEKATAKSPARTEEVSSMPMPPPTAGIPLRDDPPKPSSVGRDNPYE